MTIGDSRGKLRYRCEVPLKVSYWGINRAKLVSGAWFSYIIIYIFFNFGY